MLGEELRRIRHEKRLTQEQVALGSGVDRAYLSELESGKKQPSVEVLIRLCKALGESAGVMIGKIEGLDLHPTGKGLAKLVYDENGILTKIIDNQGRELVADFKWVEPGVSSAASASVAASVPERNTGKG